MTKDEVVEELEASAKAAQRDMTHYHEGGHWAGFNEASSRKSAYEHAISLINNMV